MRMGVQILKRTLTYDGVNDDIDTCANTPSGETVDENGCSDFPKDLDGDGFIGSEDCDDTNDAHKSKC